jgi:hypothetical protein
MAYIIKNTSGLVNTRITDVGRQKLSQGKFNVAYFQVGDSEISYDKLPSSYNQSNSYVLEPGFNSQNISGVPQSNRQYVKYPYYTDSNQLNTYGIPFMDSQVDSVFNRAPLRGFFGGITTATTVNWDVLVDNRYTLSSNYIVDMSTLDGSNQITLIYSGCNYTSEYRPQIGDIITIFYDGQADDNCSCINLPTPTPSPTGTTTTTSTTSTTTVLPCLSPTPTPTPTQTPCLTPTPTPQCPLPPAPECIMPMSSCTTMLTYRVIDVCLDTITLDRNTPDFTCMGLSCYSRVLFYPSNMTQIYDSFTPMPHWGEQVIDFESICDTDQFDVKVWNMNIPWTENPAGLIPTLFKGYENFGSINYIGSKEYFGYNSSEGQTDTSSTFYYNSFDEIVTVEPEEQKAIAIIHYTNQTIDFFYGEKFALEPYDPTNPQDTTGQARNFKLHIPWLMWHKNPNCCNGETFWVDPPGFEGIELFTPHYIKSKKNTGMNQPGIRYYHLWDTNPNTDGLPNRIGKVFPDSKLIIIDDEEIIAAMSYKSNRNWTLPAPQISLLTPNTCDTTTSAQGILTGSSQTMYVTYRFTNDYCYTNSLHCNYYTKIQGNNNECNPDTSKNVAIRFGGEFGCLIQPYVYPATTTTTTLPFCGSYFVANSGVTGNTIVEFEACCNESQTSPLILSAGTNVIICSSNGITLSGDAIVDLVEECSGCTITSTTTAAPCLFCDIPKGYFGDKFEILAQKVPTGQRPDPSLWRVIDFTNILSGSSIYGFITQDALTGNTFVISEENYNSAPYYNLNNYITLVSGTTSGTSLNFGDEYYFYGSFETDIQATIYEMKYKINLSSSEFQVTTNPSWTPGTKSYVTEIALLDSDKDILVMSKLQSPTLRQGLQQYVIKIDI